MNKDEENSLNAQIQYRLIEELTEINNKLKAEIEERKQTEKKLVVAKNKAESAAKVKAQFLANMSHEIRTPLNGVLGLGNLLLNTQLSSKQKKYLDAIIASSDSLLVIVNDILDISKMEAGKLIFEKKDFNLINSILSVVEIFERRVEKKQLKISCEIDPSIPVVLSGDAVRLNQILYNLIGNAVKFTEKGEINVLINKIRTTNNTVELALHIKDTGIGISQNKTQKIFNVFTQAKGETTRKYGGSGLGLTIVKRIVELQGGTVEVISKLNVGSEFIVKMSFEIANDESANKLSPINKQCDRCINFSCLKGIRVLLAEDHPVNQMVAVEMLSRMDAIIDVANDGKQALEMLKKEEYDLILMDMQMPEIDGYQAMRIIRDEFPSEVSNIPIIAVTAHAMEGENNKCKQAGADDYVSKPFTPEELFYKIGKQIKNCNNLL